MTDAFQNVLNMSITGAYIAAAIIVLRLCMKRLPRRYSYALWSILGIRLLCPFSFSSAVSLFNLLKPTVAGSKITYIPQNIAYAEIPAVNVGIPAVNEAVNAALPAAEPAASVNPVQILLFAAATIWLVGIAAMLAYSVASYLAVRRRVSSATLLRENVYICGNIETPFVYGITKPKIYIPANVSGNDLDYILAHERAHIKRGDHITKLLALAALTLHWFNPFAWLSFKLMTKDMELSCDERVLVQLGHDVKKPYAEALLNISVKQNKLSYGGLLSFGESSIKSRIKGVLAAKKPTVIVTAVAVAAVIIAAACLLTNAEGGNKTLLDEAVNADYALYALNRASVERECTPAEVSSLADKLADIQNERVDSGKLSFPSGGYNYTITAYPDADSTAKHTSLDFSAAYDENGEMIYCINILETSSNDVYKISEEDYYEIRSLIDVFFDGNAFSSAINADYSSYALIAADVEREFAKSEIMPLLDRLGTVSTELFEPTEIVSDPTPNTLKMYSQNGEYTCVVLMNAVNAENDNVFYISLAATDAVNCYKIPESDWYEISTVFGSCYNRNIDGLQTTSPAAEPVPQDSAGNGEADVLAPLSLLGYYVGDDGRYRVRGEEWGIQEDYDIFRKYFFGTWSYPDGSQADFIIDDSEKCFFSAEHEFHFDNCYIVSDTVLLFRYGGSGGGTVYWLDTEKPDTLYGAYGGWGEHDFIYSDEKDVPMVWSHTKTSTLTSTSAEGYLSILKLRELARDHGIEPDMLYNIEYENGSGTERLYHDDWYQFYPVYLVSETADRLTLKTTVGNAYSLYERADVLLTLEKSGGVWTRTVEIRKAISVISDPPSFIYTGGGAAFQQTALNAVTAFLRGDREALSACLTNADYDAGLDGGNIYDNILYMVLDVGSHDGEAENDVVYPAVCRFAAQDSDTLSYINLGLKKTSDGWKVEYIYLQG